MSKEYPCVYYNNEKCKKFSDDEYTSYCLFGPCKDETPSNADRIRAMTDEELAKTFDCEFTACPPNVEEDRWCDIDDGCKQCWLNWLQQPVKEGAE